MCGHIYHYLFTSKIYSNKPPSHTDCTGVSLPQHLFGVLNTIKYVSQQFNLSPSQSGELELLHTVQQEASQVCLADASNWVDVSTGAVVLGEISCQTEQEN